jgi:hypothetical protein
VEQLLANHWPLARSHYVESGIAHR